MRDSNVFFLAGRLGLDPKVRTSATPNVTRIIERVGLVPDPRVRTHATSNVTQVIERMDLVPDLLDRVGAIIRLKHFKPL